uniref:C4b-binding protein alpha chain-like n=1 Tax=Styela clava TaxID=7725 RepID=UPI001939BB76|nr:C4b-binding protein alpha chain-like [Styela clava]
MMGLFNVFSLVCCFLFVQGIFSIEVDKECQYRELKYGGTNPEEGPYVMKTVVKYHCDAGYTLYGEASSVCLYGIWTEELPVCVADQFN